MEPSQHILVVDDDPEIRLLLGDYLRKNGYRATTVADGAGMRKTLKREEVALLVLDIMLRGDDGLALCREVRAQGCTPIIMLTARGDPLDKVIGIEMGADDYLAKPFLPRELLARIRSVLRRVDQSSRQSAGPDVQRYRFASWSLDTVTRNLTDSGGVIVPLSGSEFRLLARLLSSHKKVLTRAQLAEGNGQRTGGPFRSQHRRMHQPAAPDSSGRCPGAGDNKNRLRRGLCHRRGRRGGLKALPLKIQSDSLSTRLLLAMFGDDPGRPIDQQRDLLLRAQDHGGANGPRFSGPKGSGIWCASSKCWMRPNAASSWPR